MDETDSSIKTADTLTQSLNNAHFEAQAAAYPIPDILVEDSINGDRAMSYEELIDLGIEKQDYDFKNLPLGETNVRLDFKLWGSQTT